MSHKRSYRLLCPIARALDSVGDRWTLLILRDLHAGPARFGDLQAGLSGLASNLLTSRLRQLEDDGLIARGSAAKGPQFYQLTADGEATAPLLFELARYGSRFPHPENLRPPGNLRTLAVTLKEALRRVADAETNARVEYVVDGECFAVTIDQGTVSVTYAADPEAPVSIATDYSAIVAVADGDMALPDFAAQHIRLTRGSEESAQGFLRLMGKAFASGQ
ncbi:MAG: DNA-binding HxlR family transcriptional regulator [Bradymonadia bacterium]|jgi:DNA-binding HxlR family transcriptional regulator